MIEFEIVETSEQRNEFGAIINRHHSYIKHKQVPTRHIDYLIYNDQKLPIGAIGINSCVYNLKARDEILGLNQKNKPSKLKQIANNYRFALINQRIKFKNAGTQILKRLRQVAPIDWERKYGDKLIAIETFVKPPWTGAVYKADNWKFLGMTKGFSSRRVSKKMFKNAEVAERYIEKFKLKNKCSGTAIYKKTQPKQIFLIIL